MGYTVDDPRELEWGWGRTKPGHPSILPLRALGLRGRWELTRPSLLSAQDGKMVIPWSPGGQSHDLCVFGGLEVWVADPLLVTGSPGDLGSFMARSWGSWGTRSRAAQTSYC